MARLVIAALLSAAFAAVVAAALAGVRISGPKRMQLLEAEMEREGLQRVAFVLLIALILYVAVTGGQF